MKDEGCQKILQPSTGDYHRRISTQNRHVVANIMAVKKRRTYLSMRIDNRNEKRERDSQLQFRDRDRGPALCANLSVTYVCELFVLCTSRGLTIARYITCRCSDCQYTASLTSTSSRLLPVVEVERGRQLPLNVHAIVRQDDSP